MNKPQALNNFWNSFGWSAYDENSVPDSVSFPYITYSVALDSINNSVSLTGSLWDRSNSWERVSIKLEEIEEAIGKYGFYTVKLDNGYLWLTKGSPFAQRMGDPNDDKIKRIYLNVVGEFLTAY